MTAATESEGSIRLRSGLRLKNVDIRGNIGKGSYSKVKLAYSNSMKKLIAVKIIDRNANSEYIKKFLPRELEIIRRLDHGNIVRVYQILEMGSSMCLLEEYGENGDLLQRIKNKKRLDEAEARFYFRQILEALAYLHTASIVHRDIKCENIFLDSYFNVKLGDFGFARYLQKGETSSTFCGSRAYVAPEILRGIAYTGNTSDTWSAGIVLYIMVTGVMPFDDSKPRKMVERMLAHRIRYPDVELSQDVKSLIFEILHPQPTMRPTHATMIGTPFLRTQPYAFRT